MTVVMSLRGTLEQLLDDVQAEWPSTSYEGQRAAILRAALADGSIVELLYEFHTFDGYELLTPEEFAALRLTAALANLLARVVGDGLMAGQDIAELYHHLHVIQRYIGSQAAARAYPTEFRLLGWTIPVEGE